MAGIKERLGLSYSWDDDPSQALVVRKRRRIALVALVVLLVAALLCTVAVRVQHDRAFTFGDDFLNTRSTACAGADLAVSTDGAPVEGSKAGVSILVDSDWELEVVGSGEDMGSVVYKLPGDRFIYVSVYDLEECYPETFAYDDTGDVRMRRELLMARNICFDVRGLYPDSLSEDTYEDGVLSADIIPDEYYGYGIPSGETVFMRYPDRIVNVAYVCSDGDHVGGDAMFQAVVDSIKVYDTDGNVLPRLVGSGETHEYLITSGDPLEY